MLWQTLFCFHLQAPSKGRITDLVTTGRALVQETTDFLKLALPKLEPVSTRQQHAQASLRYNKPLEQNDIQQFLCVLYYVPYTLPMRISKIILSGSFVYPAGSAT